MFWRDAILGFVLFGVVPLLLAWVWECVGRARRNRRLRSGGWVRSGGPGGWKVGG